MTRGPHSPEHRRKLSEALRRRWLTDPRLLAVKAAAAKCVMPAHQVRAVASAEVLASIATDPVEAEIFGPRA